MRETRAAEIAAEIEASIVAGDVRVGTRLGTKDDLRRRYDVAYGTVNEALRILQLRGYLRARSGHGGGVFASAPSSQTRLRDALLGGGRSDAADYSEVRRVLEAGLTLCPARADNPVLRALERLLREAERR